MAFFYSCANCSFVSRKIRFGEFRREFFRKSGTFSKFRNSDAREQKLKNYLKIILYSNHAIALMFESFFSIFIRICTFFYSRIPIHIPVTYFSSLVCFFQIQRNVCGVNMHSGTISKYTRPIKQRSGGSFSSSERAARRMFESRISATSRERTEETSGETSLPYSKRDEMEGGYKSMRKQLCAGCSRFVVRRSTCAPHRRRGWVGRWGRGGGREENKCESIGSLIIRRPLKGRKGSAAGTKRLPGSEPEILPALKGIYSICIPYTLSRLSRSSRVKHSRRNKKNALVIRAIKIQLARIKFHSSGDDKPAPIDNAIGCSLAANAPGFSHVLRISARDLRLEKLVKFYMKFRTHPAGGFGNPPVVRYKLFHSRLIISVKCLR